MVITSFCTIFKFPSYSNCLLTALSLLAIAFVGFTLFLFMHSWLFPRSFEYSNKHVLITGGSQGIGLELAREYLRRGAKVTIAARNVDILQAARKDLENTTINSKDGLRKSDELLTDLTDRVAILSVDVGSPYNALETKFNEAVNKFGDIDVLINCAGISFSGELEKMKIEDYEKLLRVNVLGSMHATRFVIPSMKAKKNGRIVFISSQVAQVAVHGYAAYAASKWALRGLAEALQMELRPYNVFVSVSYPPDTDTPGYKHEMLTKPDLTKKISDSGNIFTAKEIALDVVNGSTVGYFGISNGVDGWLLKQLHPGMTPLNCFVEAWQQICFSGLARLISLFYLLSWDSEISSYVSKIEASNKS